MALLVYIDGISVFYGSCIIVLVVFESFAMGNSYFLAGFLFFQV